MKVDSRAQEYHGIYLQEEAKFRDIVGKMKNEVIIWRESGITVEKIEAVRIINSFIPSDMCWESFIYQTSRHWG